MWARRTASTAGCLQRMAHFRAVTPMMSIYRALAPADSRILTHSMCPSIEVAIKGENPSSMTLFTSPPALISSFSTSARP